MNYKLIKDVLDLLEIFENSTNKNSYNQDINGFKKWLSQEESSFDNYKEGIWENKEKGRSIESVISTHLVHLNRFAKYYSKQAIANTKFSTQDDFIYLINLVAFGEMSKMDLIKKNMHDKPAGMKIINRLIDLGWIEQTESNLDKRSKLIKITNKGKESLDEVMDDIRKATLIVTGNLTENEKLHLIYLLNKLENFHIPIYNNEIEKKHTLDIIAKKYL